MKKNIVWLGLCFGEALASNIRRPVRVRQVVSPHHNSSGPIATSNATDTSTSTITTFTSTYIQVDTTSTSTDDPSRSDFTKPTEKPKDNGSTLHITGDASHNSTGRPSNCIDTVVTYTEQPPETVYVTVTGSYDVSVSASNVSVNAPTIYETPLQPCQSTVIPKFSSAPVWSMWGTLSLTASTRWHTSQSVPVRTSSNTPEGYAGVSTVYVTKKTPVVIVQTPTGPGVTFQQPTPVNSPKSPLGVVTTPPQTSGKDEGSPSNPDGQNNDSRPSSNQQPNNSQPNNNNNNDNSNSSSKDKNNNHNPGVDSTPTGDNTPRVSNPGFQTSVGQSDGGGLASLINSVINSPFVVPSGPAQNQATPTRFIAATATPTIDGVPVTIGPSNVVIGSQSVALPTTSQVLVVVGTQTFTVRPSEIIAPGTTYQIESQTLAAPTITQAPSVITTAGVTITISQSVAIISGTMYRIGSGVKPLTTIINGQTLVIGSDGVILPGATPITFAPPMTIAGGREIVIVNGLTISVDQTVAVISGTTFAIGPGATMTTVTIGGQTLTIGPSGVGLSSTTIRPTSVPTVAANPTSNPVSMAQSTTASSQASVKTQQSLLSLALTWIMVLLPQMFLSI